jgi:hypothetical protein
MTTMFTARRNVLPVVLLLWIVLACAACGSTSNPGVDSGPPNPCRLNPDLFECQQGGGNDHSDELRRQLELQREQQRLHADDRVRLWK